MRNLLAFVAFVVIAVGGVGFYMDWFNIRSTPSANGQKSFTLDVNTDKIGDDVRHLEDKAQQRLSEQKEHARHKSNDVSIPTRRPAKMPPVDVHDVLRDR